MYGFVHYNSDVSFFHATKSHTHHTYVILTDILKTLAACQHLHAWYELFVWPHMYAIIIAGHRIHDWTYSLFLHYERKMWLVQSLFHSWWSFCYITPLTSLPMPAVVAPWVGWLVAFVALCVCVWLCVHAVKGKQLELSTLNLVDILCMAVAWHAVTLRSEGQRLRPYSYYICCYHGYLYR